MVTGVHSVYVHPHSLVYIVLYRYKIPMVITVTTLVTIRESSITELVSTKC